jgi:Tfp pilus assembly protein PilV
MSHRACRLCARPSTQPYPASKTARNRGRDDRGNTLIEVVITVVLMAIVVVPVLSAVRTSVAASSVSRSAAQVETALVNAADRVNRAPKRCNYTMYAQAAMRIQGWPASTASVTHEYYVPGVDARTPGTWKSGDALSPGCAGLAPTDLLVQRVTINLTSPDGAIHRSIQVVKSDV